MTKIHILYFGEIAEIVGKDKEVSNFIDSNQFRNKFSSDFPQVNNKVFQLAANNKVIRENHIFKDGDILAVLPPFSGG
jgi:molybdopterin converting factor small subunit